MTRTPIAVVLLTAAAFIVAPLSNAGAITLHKDVVLPHGITGQDPTVRSVVERVAPPDSDDDGCADANDSYDGPGCSAPPPPTPAPPAAPTTSTATTATSSSVSSGSGCVGMEAESGTLGYNSPGGGCYQVIPSTAQAFGCDLSTPAGQDSCAADICAAQGPSAWTNPAGENPCGRLGG